MTSSINNPAHGHTLYTAWYVQQVVVAQGGKPPYPKGWAELTDAEKETWAIVAKQMIEHYVRTMPILEPAAILREKLEARKADAIETGFQRINSAIDQLETLQAFISTYLVPMPKEDGVL